MKTSLSLRYGALTFALLLAGCAKDSITDVAPQPTAAPTADADATLAPVRVFATGLNNPRGLKFGPDGYLYVAEGGTGGTNSTVGICPQVPFPVGPVTGSPTGGRISRISRAGVRSTVADDFPSSKGNELTGGDIQGVSDVAFVGRTLYALLAAGGCAHGVPTIPNGVARVRANGTWRLIADLSSWQQSHPVQHVDSADFDPDGTPNSMINVGGELYVIEPNHGELIRVTPGGGIRRIADISASQGHIVPTCVAYNLGNFFVGNLNPFPIVQGSSKVYLITPTGRVQPLVSGLTTVLALAFDRLSRLYVLENTTGAPFPTPGTGRVVRLDLLGGKTTIASGLTLPTGMTFGPDGKLYVSNVGFGPQALGGGQILQIDVRYPTLPFPFKENPGEVTEAPAASVE